MRVPKSFSGPTQLLGMSLVDRRGVRSLIALPPEPGLAGLFGPVLPDLRVHYLDYSVYRRDREAATASGVAAALTFSSEWEDADNRELAMMFLPKEKELTLHVFCRLRETLPRGASVYLVGPKRGGIASVRPLVEQYLGLFRSSRSARHSVLVEAVTGDTGESFSGRKQFTVPFRDRTIDVVSYPGVFSHGELDPGTGMLLEAMGNVPYTQALDWGCGCGILGTALRLRRPEARVDLVDSNAMAVMASRETLEANDLGTERVWPSDGLSDVSDTYDLIVSNPPFHSGIRTEFTVTERFIRDSRDHLADSGRLLLVVNTFINYFPALRETYPIVKVLHETPRYRIIEARKG